MKKNLNLNNTALSVSLSVLAPYVFFWSRNWHMFNFDELFFSVFLLLLFACAIFIIGSLLQSSFIKFFPFGSEKTKRALCNFIYTLASVALLAFLFKLLYPYGVNKHLFFGVITAAGALVIFAGKLQRFLNIFLIVIICFNSVNLVYSLLFTSSYDMADANLIDAEEPVALKKKPNVYLFILESYNSLEVMNSVYGIDTGEFKDFMVRNDFIYYNNSYSNSPSTMLSLCDLFALKDYNRLARGNMDVAVEARLMVGGDDNNVVFKTFKKNGYHVESLWLEDQSYYILQQGPNLDKVDKFFSSELDRLLQPIYTINNNILSTVRKFFKRPPKVPLMEAITASIRSRPQNGWPFFLSVKTGADHSPNFYTWKPDSDWKDSGQYQNLVSNSITELLEALARIIKDDPDALIVLIGDHGAHRLRGLLPGHVTSDAQIDKICASYDITREDLANDLFNIFLAVRMPGGAQDISRGYNISHRNLFLHIFSALNDDPSLLSKRQPSVSRHKNMITTREGIILDRWILE